MTDRPSITRARRLAAAALAAGLVLALGACGDDDDDAADTTEEDSPSAGTDGGGDATLEVSEFDFEDVSAPAGGTLAVTNSSGGAHTFTADDGEFDEELPDGETVDVAVPAEPGDYPFHCEIHPSMEATLTAE
ncbi:MAG TPA: cupredoxin domain-containing protein [Acidimicrobiales bacterium]|nr:cupredoxin domain-containing protein [Acidimicrobiales bacterium]